jgi:enoyl-CoA hydratase/carnithine racemase
MAEERSLDEPLVLSTRRDGIATLQLNSPSNFNALSSAMIAALQFELDSLANDRKIRVVILAASGRAFCAGHDLREMREHDDEEWHRALFDQCSKLMMTIEALSQPVIAKVQGVATAAGCQLVATCDLAIASLDAKFATSGINLGLFCSTPAVAVSRVMPAKKAAELLFTGEFIDSATARELGLINEAVPSAALDGATDSLAQRIAQQSGAALASGKRLLKSLRAVGKMPESADAYVIAAANMARDMQTADAKAGIDAFLNKTARVAWSHH